jgi:hypothetical protein
MGTKIALKTGAVLLSTALLWGCAIQMPHGARYFQRAKERYEKRDDLSNEITNATTLELRPKWGTEITTEEIDNATMAMRLKLLKREFLEDARISRIRGIESLLESEIGEDLLLEAGLWSDAKGREASIAKLYPTLRKFSSIKASFEKRYSELQTEGVWGADTIGTLHTVAEAYQYAIFENQVAIKDGVVSYSESEFSALDCDVSGKLFICFGREKGLDLTGLYLIPTDSIKRGHYVVALRGKNGEITHHIESVMLLFSKELFEYIAELDSILQKNYEQIKLAREQDAECAAIIDNKKNALIAQGRYKKALAVLDSLKLNTDDLQKNILELQKIRDTLITPPEGTILEVNDWIAVQNGSWKGFWCFYVEPIDVFDHSCREEMPMKEVKFE